MGSEPVSVDWICFECKYLNRWKRFGVRWFALDCILAASVSAIRQTKPLIFLGKSGAFLFDYQNDLQAAEPVYRG